VGLTMEAFMQNVCVFAFISWRRCFAAARLSSGFDDLMRNMCVQLS
jgi:hypothetical protein